MYETHPDAAYNGMHPRRVGLCCCSLLSGGLGAGLQRGIQRLSVSNHLISSPCEGIFSFLWVFFLVTAAYSRARRGEEHTRPEHGKGGITCPEVAVGARHRGVTCLLAFGGQLWVYSIPGTACHPCGHDTVRYGMVCCCWGALFCSHAGYTCSRSHELLNPGWQRTNRYSRWRFESREVCVAGESK